MIKTETSQNIVENTTLNENKPMKKEKKQKNSRINEIILRDTTDEPLPTDPIHVYIEKLIPKIIDQYVKENKRPIRRKDLIEYVFSYDDRMIEYDKVSKHSPAAISFAITRLLKKGRLVRIKYCKEWEGDKCVKFSRKKEYILKEHLQMPEIQEYLKKHGLS
ncbi:hypothetical protein J5U23_02895 [Saccharolobus shibatae B12]|uniref:Uncharacterized protein n=1 Tax=Saccharolobus shibatae (strain ATCC 51178 / DSM 5389 / JCM 8931 / NBRC 15437 / B12) TaxID=523848 RepID=A0A8F5BR80_SACSH|nr:hypothetical protein [Saccharolobus shibatae]QXJ27113.1 hypothetical protein J5U23_p2895 [Saccharolobus shibatae B12]QXJ30006.1 hypothetical protein J5U23_02895 [Saccharolobus shibatae B12]